MADDAPSITAEELATWLTPREALTVLEKAFSAAIATEALLDRARGGIIKAAAQHLALETGGKAAGLVPTVLIAKDFWTYFPDTAAERARFWATGDVRFYLGVQDRLHGYGYGDEKAVNCFGIRFEPTGVRGLLPTTPSPGSVLSVPPATPSPPTEATNKGGRPPLPFWEDLWIEMCRQIYAGQLWTDVRTQASIQRAMLAWATAQGHEMGDSTARNAARKLYGALIKEEGKN